MSTTTPSSTTATSDDKVFVPIPKAGPGQGYHAPKIIAMPLVDTLTKLFVFGAALSLPVIPLLILGMIVNQTYASEPYLLWVWITMAVITTSIALPVAIGIIREVLGYSRQSDYLPAKR